MQGEFSLALRNKSRTREAPTPTNISTNSEPEMLKKGTPASPAIAFANMVLPVPGGPINRTPLGILAPMALKRSGFFRKVTTSCNSSFASSIPATSSNITPVLASIWKRARDLPKFMAFPCDWVDRRRIAISAANTMKITSKFTTKLTAAVLSAVCLTSESIFLARICEYSSRLL